MANLLLRGVCLHRCSPEMAGASERLEELWMGSWDLKSFSKLFLLATSSAEAFPSLHCLSRLCVGAIITTMHAQCTCFGIYITSHTELELELRIVNYGKRSFQAGEMACHVKALTLYAWWSDFSPWSPQWREWFDSWKLSSAHHRSTVSCMCARGTCTCVQTGSIVT